MQDEDYMALALEEERQAGNENEAPVGAVLVFEERVMARNHNRMVQQKNPIAHAELLTMQAALKGHPVKWLLDTTLYVTLEPCVMCAGALVLARVKRIVYAAADPKAGMAGSLGNILQDARLNHRTELTSGVLTEPCGDILRAFFRARR